MASQSLNPNNRDAGPYGLDWDAFGGYALRLRWQYIVDVARQHYIISWTPGNTPGNQGLLALEGVSGIGALVPIVAPQIRYRGQYGLEVQPDYTRVPPAFRPKTFYG